MHLGILKITAQHVRSLVEEGRTMFLVTHEIAFARNVSDRVIKTEGGVVIADGQSDEVMGENRPSEQR